jgi:hypothetical protein
MPSSYPDTPAMPNRTFVDYYRCPDIFAEFAADDGEKRRRLFVPGTPMHTFRPDLYDALAAVVIEGTTLRLPFNPSEITESLRRERYLEAAHLDDAKTSYERFIWSVYHFLRPALPITVRKRLQQRYLAGWDRLAFPSWPVDTTVEDIVEALLSLAVQAHGGSPIPFIWFWPRGARSCAIVTHDVETAAGRDFSRHLMDLDDSVGIKASFQIVPERRYQVSSRFLDGIRARGFEVNVHDLNHDGNLFTNRDVFRRRIERINAYAKSFGAMGFRSGKLDRNPEWFDALEFSYDMSIPNVAHLDPQRGGCCTVFPFFIGNVLELPVTMTQDYSLFHILNDYSIALWRRQIELIMERHGLVSVIVHPDYVIDTRARATYAALLGHLARLRSDGLVWIALPREVDQWWRERSHMKVVGDGRTWRIEGNASGRARLAFATLDADRVRFTIHADAEDGVTERAPA